jgi:hypothetical protein
MGRRGFFFLSSWLVVIALPTTASAQERSAPAGAVVVRGVQVREVRVNQPASRSPREERPSFGVERPVDPGFISRPVPRPQFTPSQSPSLRHSRRNVRRHQPAYIFAPRFNTGYGVVVGYPVIYPYVSTYGDPFSPSPSVVYAPPAPARNTYSNVDGVTSSTSVTAASPRSAAIQCESAAPCGGLSFEITPASAQISVDGEFVGIVDDFTAMSEPLLLAPGTHYVEIRLAGFRTVSFDVTVAPGEVTPYQGTLERLRLRAQ